MRRTKRLLLVFIISFSLAQPALSKLRPTKMPFDDWMMYYYLDKDSSRTADFLLWLQSSPLNQKKNIIPPLSAFLSVIFADNPDKVNHWIHSGNFTDQTRLVIITALWLAKNQTELKNFTSDIPDYAKQPAPVLAEAPVYAPHHLDMMWGAFTASGDPRYVHKIIDVLADDNIDPITKAAAQWSLRSNMRQHKLVKKIVKSEIKTRTGEIKAALKKL